MLMWASGSGWLTGCLVAVLAMVKAICLGGRRELPAVNFYCVMQGKTDKLITVTFTRHSMCAIGLRHT